MEAYILYRKDEKTSLVFKDLNDDELYALIKKIERGRSKVWKTFAGELLADFFEKSSADDPEPPVREVRTTQGKN